MNMFHKYLLVSSSLFLLGCSQIQKSQDELSKADMSLNERCEKEIQEIRIFQVLDDTKSLGFVCDGSSDTCSGLTVVVPSLGEMHWDDKRVRAPKDQCIVIRGTYKYTTKQDFEKTVPVIDFEYMYPPKDINEVQKRLEEFTEVMKKECLLDANKEKHSLQEKKIKQCDCYVDLMRTQFNEVLSNGEYDEEQFRKNWQTQALKKCGK